MNFTSNQKTIIDFESKFIKIDKTEFDRTIEYINPYDNSKWLKLRLCIGDQGGGYPVMMRKTELTTEYLIDTVLSTADIEQMSVGSALLEYFESFHKIEFRAELINKLEIYFAEFNTRNNKFEKKRFEVIIKNCALYDDTNRREIVGKNNAEITADYDFFRRIAGRVEKLQELILKITNFNP